MSRMYSHLSAEERAVIMIQKQAGASLRAIGRMLGRSPATISREIRRAGGARYDAKAAAEGYRKRRLNSRRRPVLIEGSPLYQHVHDHLIYRHWSPQQIAAKLRTLRADARPGIVSHETIYASIYARPHGVLRQGVIQALRQSKARRGRWRVTAARAGFVPANKQIAYRPAHVEQRMFPGHWEGDFIKGAYNRSAVGVLVERKTRFVVLCKMGGCTADDALRGYGRQMKKLPQFLRRSMTYDRGGEMACHEALSQRLKLDIWFCDPHAPWQRASNENTNGLLRQYLPKGTDLSQFGQTRLNDIARLLNSRPRQTLAWQTPDELMAEEIKRFTNSTDGVKRVL